MNPDPAFSLHLVGRIVAVGLALSSFEYLSMRKEFRAGGVYNGVPLPSRNMPAAFPGFLFS